MADHEVRKELKNRRKVMMTVREMHLSSHECSCVPARVQQENPRRMTSLRRVDRCCDGFHVGSNPIFSEAGLGTHEKGKEALPGLPSEGRCLEGVLLHEVHSNSGIET